ncbi:hypothetical protein H0A66_15100 [Alcaligenaceae bacterium]|nr:hypothetical protein [Alcaligenaceae bacterium]
MSKKETESAVQPYIAKMQAIENQHGINRDSLDQILDTLIDLSAITNLWGADRYPDPAEGVLQERYLIHEESDRSFALYLNVMRTGKKIIPHNHTTWACIAAVTGTEYNYVFERHDDGSVPGHAVIAQTKEIQVSPGSGIALMAEDIHAVHIKEDKVIRHLHMYGKALETLNERVAFDTDTNTCRIMDIGVQTKR